MDLTRKLSLIKQLFIKLELHRHSSPTIGMELHIGAKKVNMSIHKSAPHSSQSLTLRNTNIVNWFVTQIPKSPIPVRIDYCSTIHFNDNTRTLKITWNVINLRARGIASINNYVKSIVAGITNIMPR